MKSNGRLATFVAVTAWLSAILIGLAWLHRHQTTAGNSGEESPRWPEGTQLALDPQRPTLVLFAHPRCPCLGASLEGLEVALRRIQGRVATRIVVFGPEPPRRGWVPDGLFDGLRSLPGVVLFDDAGGHEAGRFGVMTSGDIRVYSPSGLLLFHGGNTSARGESGESEAGRRLLDVLRGNPGVGPIPCRTPIYGCPIRVSPGPTASSSNRWRNLVLMEPEKLMDVARVRPAVVVSSAGIRPTDGGNDLATNLGATAAPVACPSGVARRSTPTPTRGNDRAGRPSTT